MIKGTSTEIFLYSSAIPEHNYLKESWSGALYCKGCASYQKEEKCHVGPTFKVHSAILKVHLSETHFVKVWTFTFLFFATKYCTLKVHIDQLWKLLLLCYTLKVHIWEGVLFCVILYNYVLLCAPMCHCVYSESIFWRDPFVQCNEESHVRAVFHCFNCNQVQIGAKMQKSEKYNLQKQGNMPIVE